MAVFAKLTVMGYLVGDAKLRTVQTANGETALCEFGIGINTGKRREDRVNDIVNFVIWGNYAESQAPKLKKGELVFVEATPYKSERTYEKDGQPIVLRDVQGKVEQLRFCSQPSGNDAAEAYTEEEDTVADPF